MHNDQLIIAKNIEHNKSAIECFDKAISLKPDYAEAYYNKGVALMYNGLYVDAICCLEKAIKINPNFYDAYYLKGLIFLKLHPKHEQISYDAHACDKKYIKGYF